MTIPTLISQYFYENNHLELPGLGKFNFAPVDTANLEPKKTKSVPSGTLSFENNTAIKENTELVNYIAAKTGKIKALAAADLHSHLELARQFLNIGKPFLFEGIGSLKKNQNGTFSLSSEYPDEMFRDVSVNDNPNKNETASGYSGFRNLLKPVKQKMSWRKPALIILIAAGIGLAVWGGYTVYKFTTSKNQSSSANEEKTEIKSVNNISTTSITDSIQKPDSNGFKFIVEVANKERAISRYNHLKFIKIHNAKLETKDSISFNIYFLIPAAASDTARIIDSLRKNYTPAGKRAFVIAN